MLKRLKNYPLIGLTLAIAGGLVLAHAIESFAEDFWYNFLADFFDRNGWELFDFAFVGGLIALMVWMYRRKRRSISALR